MGFEARIWASRLEIRPQDWKLGLETGNWASRLGFEGGGTEEEEEEKKEKIHHMCESIGHRPLRGRCPKTGVGTTISSHYHSEYLEVITTFNTRYDYVSFSLNRIKKQDLPSQSLLSKEEVWQKNWEKSTSTKSREKN